MDRTDQVLCIVAQAVMFYKHSVVPQDLAIFGFLLSLFCGPEVASFLTAAMFLRVCGIF